MDLMSKISPGDEVNDAPFDALIGLGLGMILQSWLCGETEVERERRGIL